MLALMFHRAGDIAPSVERALVCKLLTAGTFMLFYSTPAGSHFPAGHPLHRRPIWNPHLKPGLVTRSNPPVPCVASHPNWMCCTDRTLFFSAWKRPGARRCWRSESVERHMNYWSLLSGCVQRARGESCQTNQPVMLKEWHSGFSARTWLLIPLVGYFNWLIVEQFSSVCSTHWRGSQQFWLLFPFESL